MADAHRLANELRAQRRKPEAPRPSGDSGAADTERLAALGRLISSMAHEIGTPLGVARISASLLDEQRANLAQHLAAHTLTQRTLEQFLDDTDAASAMLAANLGRIAQLVGNFRQIAVERRSEERRTLRLVPFVEEVLQHLEPVLLRARVRFEVHGDRNFADQIYPGALARLITTLVENAVMHAYDGIDEPHLRVEVSALGDDCLLFCEDNGVGIADPDLIRVFEPFFTTRRMSGGTGLGLYVAHNIAHELLHGGISAESVSPHGCRIVVRWPATRVIDP